jgi:hypothetical protein
MTQLLPRGYEAPERSARSFGDRYARPISLGMEARERHGRRECNEYGERVP